MINFNSEIPHFKIKNIRVRKKWLNAIASLEGFKIIELNYIFLTDNELLKINQKYLQHDTYTDIITFDYSDIDEAIEGDIFISIERVMENAVTFKVDFETELNRVLAHGLLHLCGFNDKTEAEVIEMRAKEAFHLQQI